MRQKDSAILLITHNLAVVAETCDRVAVMYGGKIQELAPVEASCSRTRCTRTRAGCSDRCRASTARKPSG